ncbi:MAG TPA: PspC domain-containing protein [Streptosporangiaceae bacterium]|nr:PspC domain-containing protein [Streptosporangiaceae bacterium]
MNDYASQPTDQVPSGEQPASEPAQEQPPAAYQPRPSGYEALYRPVSGRMIAGVAAGIAQYLGVDVTIVRVALALLTVIGGAGIPVYVAGWLLMPDEESDQSIASELLSSLQSRPS